MKSECTCEWCEYSRYLGDDEWLCCCYGAKKFDKFVDREDTCGDASYHAHKWKEDDFSARNMWLDHLGGYDG